MAAFSFLGAGYSLGSSGVGFYGDSAFGSSVAVGAYQGRTFMTNSVGTQEGYELPNVKYLNAASGILGQTGSGVHVLNIPNYLASLQIHFNHSSAVQLQNTSVRAYDRVSINNDPSGVTVFAAEIAHPSLSQLVQGSGTSLWQEIYGSGSILSLNDSPGPSGQYNNQSSAWSSTDHDYYLALSCSPDTISSKYFSLYVETEYF